MKRIYLTFCAFGAALFVALPVAVLTRNTAVVSPIAMSRPPRISPDYSGTAIPPNIAPLNFAIKERARNYRIRIYSTYGDTIVIFASRPEVIIPLSKWRRLLRLNRNNTLVTEIDARNYDGVWNHFDPIRNRIAAEDIDGYLVYRKIFGFRTVYRMVIAQRDLQNYHEKAILDNRTFSTTSSTTKLYCINCHTFCNNRSQNVIIHLRGSKQGMLLGQGGKVTKVDTRTPFNTRPAAYSSWHPSGRLIASATIGVNQWIRSIGQPLLVFDKSSNLIIYNTDTMKVSTNPLIANPKRLETLPEWSPDGRYLYFCSAPQPDSVDNEYLTNSRYEEIKYSIMRISFDISTGAWGSLDTILSSQQTGLSIVHPKISPDGRYMLFCMLPWGYFAAYNDECDLYLMDLPTRKYHRLDSINSNYSDNFHSWSSNSRWFAFNSKRLNGMCDYTYFAYIDTAGNTYKPFIMPQKNPTAYSTLLQSFNMPVLIKEPVLISWRDFAGAVNDTTKQISAQLDSRVPVDGISSATNMK